MIDVQGMIRQASKRVSVDRLVQQGKRYINVLSKDKIDELINQAVKNIADKYRAIAAGIAGAGPVAAGTRMIGVALYISASLFLDSATYRRASS